MTKDLEFEVIESPVYYGDLQTESNNYKSLIRSDNNELLSIMKSSYKPLYVRDFKQMTNRLQKASGFEFEGYSEFDGGRVILGYLKNNQQINKMAGFDVKDYLVVGSSFNGKTSTFIGSSSIVIRCMNAFSRISKDNKFKHTISAESKLNEFVGSIEEYFALTKQMYEEFSIWNEISVKQDTAKLAIETMVDWDNHIDNSKQKQNKAEIIKKCMIEETNVFGSNLLGLFNGFTKYSSHYINEDKRSFGNIVGSGQRVNDKAYHIIKELEYSL
jgi:hypothetical protein